MEIEIKWENVDIDECVEFVRAHGFDVLEIQEELGPFYILTSSEGAQTLDADEVKNVAQQIVFQYMDF